MHIPHIYVPFSALMRRFAMRDFMGAISMRNRKSIKRFLIVGTNTCNLHLIYDTYKTILIINSILIFGKLKGQNGRMENGKTSVKKAKVVCIHNDVYSYIILYAFFNDFRCCSWFTIHKHIYEGNGIHGYKFVAPLPLYAQHTWTKIHEDEYNYPHLLSFSLSSRDRVVYVFVSKCCLKFAQVWLINSAKLHTHEQ